MRMAMWSVVMMRMVMMTLLPLVVVILMRVTGMIMLVV